FAGRHKVAGNIAVGALSDISDIFARMHAGKIEGRIVIDLSL
ncbi:MAG TPA: zinc-dependent alcohol dehydrogenase, partial [Erwinia persicina]|nr:zinc-dependent alcohol dehydrogenase [Erwinia persicina]